MLKRLILSIRILIVVKSTVIKLKVLRIRGILPIRG
jgi:hypothetical protein